MTDTERIAALETTNRLLTKELDRTREYLCERDQKMKTICDQRNEAQAQVQALTRENAELREALSGKTVSCGNCNRLEARERELVKELEEFRRIAQNDRERRAVLEKHRKPGCGHHVDVFVGEADGTYICAECWGIESDEIVASLQSEKSLLTRAVEDLKDDRRALLDAIAGELPDTGADRTVEMSVKELAGLSDAFDGAVRIAIKQRDAAESRAAELQRAIEAALKKVCGIGECAHGYERLQAALSPRQPQSEAFRCDCGNQVYPGYGDKCQECVI